MYKYTRRGRNKHKKRTCYPYTTTAKSAQTYPSGELLPVYWKNYVQIYGTATGTKTAVAFANIFMAKVTREEITQFIEQANKHHQTIKFTAEVSETETNVLPLLFTKVKDLEMSRC